jgi:hypothetical protein
MIPVINWRTASSKLVSYCKYLSFNEFQNCGLNKFENELTLPHCSLFLVTGQEPASERTRIREENFHHSIEGYFETVQISSEVFLYFHNDRNAPQESL